jgi:hypothetical protein
MPCTNMKYLYLTGSLQVSEETPCFFSKEKPDLDRTQLKLFRPPMVRIFSANSSFWPELSFSEGKQKLTKATGLKFPVVCCRRKN